MRQLVANTVLASFALAGCSLIYNPSNLPDPKTDAEPPVDAEMMTDADPSMVSLERVFPTVIFEGTGTGTNSRRVVLTIHGMHFVPGATVEVKAHSATGPQPKLNVDNSLPDRVAENGRMIAVPITLLIDPALGAGVDIRLDVSVTQMTPMGMKTVDLKSVGNDEPVLVLRGLGELTAAGMLAGGDYTYSSVNLTGDITATGEAPLRIRSTSTITINGNVRANAMARMGVAGGKDGGAGGPGGLNEGDPGGDAAPNGGGKPSGGGAGHAAPGGGGAMGGAEYGTPAMHTMFGGSGGAGGNGGAINSGGAGGGGGGIIELNSNGNLTVMTVEAKGGNGATGSSDGGGGSGGSILLRAIGAIMVTGVNVAGGTGANMGAAGRARYDASAGPMTLAGAYRGPMFAPNQPLITRSEKPTLNVIGQANEEFEYFYESEEGMGIRGPFPKAISSNGTNSIEFPEPMFRGSNKVCLLVKGAALSNQNPEARNCIQLVYLHKFQQ